MEEMHLFHVAVKGVAIKDGRALILCRADAKTPDGGDWWEFPGGTLQFGETPEQTLMREYHEETGLSVSPDGLLYAGSFINGEKYEVVIITYLCRCESTGDVVISEEHSDYRWADKAGLKELLAPDIREALDRNGCWELFD